MSIVILMLFWQSWEVLFFEGFDDFLRQVKASYSDLDLSSININAPTPTSVQPILSKSTDELFADDVPGDEEKAQDKDNTRQPIVQEENKQNSSIQQ